MRTRLEAHGTRLLLATFALTSLGACADSPPAGSTEQAAPASQEAQSLPPNHPPVANPPADAIIAPPPSGSGTGGAGLVWTTPGDWIQETPSSAMRRAQYRVPGPGGDGELVVFYFGPGQGGDAMDNAVRWANQFSQPDGRSPQEAMLTESIDVGGIPVLVTEVQGTYSGGMTMMGSPSAELENHMLLGAVAQGPDANWFFKLTGPAATLEAQRRAFRSLIESLSRGV